MRRIVVISPHPDDESIGCGGTIRQHVLAADRVDVIFLTSGEGGGSAPTRELGARREREAEAAAAVLGVAEIEFWRLPDGGLKSSPDLVERLAAELDRRRPEIVYAPHERDAHVDHRAAARLVRAAAGRVAADPPRLLGYEVWTPIQQLDEIVDIGPTIDAKLAAIGCYGSQCELVDFVAAMQGLARYRGEMHCWPEGEHAEVFIEMRPLRASAQVRRRPPS